MQDIIYNKYNIHSSNTVHVDRVDVVFVFSILCISLAAAVNPRRAEKYFMR